MHLLKHSNATPLHRIQPLKGVPLNLLTMRTPYKSLSCPAVFIYLFPVPVVHQNLEFLLPFGLHDVLVNLDCMSHTNSCRYGCVSCFWFYITTNKCIQYTYFLSGTFCNLLNRGCGCSRLQSSIAGIPSSRTAFPHNFDSELLNSVVTVLIRHTLHVLHHTLWPVARM